tara:strand:+ start:258 stop:839 length:582 start_codon:yes stop_codon:yes gene_type:complete
LNNKDYYYQLAVLHKENLEQSFLSSLGINFLRLLYREIDRDKDSVIISVKKDNRVIAFVSGTIKFNKIYKRLLLKMPWVTFAIFPKIFSFKALYKIFEILKTQLSKKNKKKLPDSELLSIAVHKNFRREGHANYLFLQLVKFFKSKEIDIFHIKVGEDLEAAHSFYKKLGAIPQSKIQIHKSENSVVYTKNVP